MTDSTDSFGYWVRRRRKALDLSQAELARQIPCSLATIKKIEADMRRPSLDMAERLAICLGLPAAERSAFLMAARGERSVARLALDGAPARRPAPVDRLPLPLTPFIGRQSDLTVLAALLAEPGVRLLSIVGPGGMGKTRLALAAAQAQASRHPRDHSDGIVFVDLASVLSPDFIAPAIAGALGLELTARRGDQRSPAEQLLEFLRPRQMLLLLDNFEHLLRAGSAGLLPALLRGAPALKLLVTSRERLNLREEHVYTLSGLRYLSPMGETGGAQPDDDSAEQLFLVSARRLRPGFALTPAEGRSLAHICRMVEGMPLALELAAAWTDSLSIGSIAAELQKGLDILASELVDLPERHRSLRTVFDATWELLEATERAVFMRLSVFRGGFTRAAAEQTSGATLSVLSRLISKCLLQFQPATERYHVHEVLRQYGQQKLSEAGELERANQRHFETNLAWAETASGHLFGPDQIAWLDRLEGEQENLRAALAWGLAQQALAEAAARLVIALAWFWRIRSHVLEGRMWLEQAVLLPNLPAEQRAGVLYHAGHLAWMQDDFDLARERAQASLRLWRTLGTSGQRGAAYANHTLGMALFGTELHVQGDLAPALAAFQESLALFRAVGDEWGVAFAQQWLAYLLTAQGQDEAARVAAENSLAGYRRLGNPWGMGLTMGALANLRLQAGDLAEARRLAEEAYALRSQVGHRHSLGVGLELLARIAIQEQKPQDAAAYFQEAIQVFESLGNRPYADTMRAALAELD